MLNANVAMLQQVLADLKESGSNETKSTAGDKHETALAMLQIEQANARGQLQELQIQKTFFEKINPALTSTTILTGSLIKTNRGYFFMSIAMRKISINNMTVFAISPQSPLGKKLMGLKTGECAVINNISYAIESIV